MNFVADEGVDRPIIERLRHDGHAVIYIADISPSVDDSVVLRQANDAGAVLVTTDKDFGELVFRQRLIHSGVILLRLAGLPVSGKAEVVAATIRDYGPRLVGVFSVVSPGAVRIRRGP